MVSPINISSATAPNWLKEAQESLAASPGGLIGTLADSKGNLGSISSFLRQSQNNAANLALVSQSTSSSAFELTIKMGSEALQKRVSERLTAQFAYNKKQQNFTPPTELDRFIYFDDGTSIDTDERIMTKPDGMKIDLKTGQEYIEPGSLIQMGNGSYLNKKTNILTMADGTKIDTVTHLVVTV
jgi:hypothetical protein